MRTIYHHRSTQRISVRPYLYIGWSPDPIRVIPVRDGQRTGWFHLVFHRHHGTSFLPDALPQGQPYRRRERHQWRSVSITIEPDSSLHHSQRLACRSQMKSSNIRLFLVRFQGKWTISTSVLEVHSRDLPANHPHERGAINSDPGYKLIFQLR